VYPKENSPEVKDSVNQPCVGQSRESEPGDQPLKLRVINH
jgi:hypothetical protein